jgi:hypothetical protein
VEYKPEDWPEAINFTSSHAYLGGVNAANEMKLMGLYLDGLRKVTDDTERVLELAAEEAD